MNFYVTFRRKLVSRCHSSYIQYGVAVKGRLAARRSDCSGVPDATSFTSFIASVLTKVRSVSEPPFIARERYT